MALELVNVAARSIEPLGDLCGRSELLRTERAAQALKRTLGDHVVFNVNSTAHGGGVAGFVN